MRWIIEVQSRIRELADWRNLRGQSGQELIEYALMAGFVSVSVAAFIPYTITGPINSIFSKIMVFLHELGGA